MTEAGVIKALAEFFLEEFSQDAASVGDWVAQGGHDVNEFYETTKLIKAGADSKEIAAISSHMRGTE